MADELDTLVEAIATMMEGVEGINVVHTELPPVLTHPPEAWVKMGSGTSAPFEFGQQSEEHTIDIWIWIGKTKFAENESTLRKLWHRVLRAILADETFGEACEGVWGPMTYDTGWQPVGGIEYRRMAITIPCTVEAFAIG